MNSVKNVNSNTEEVWKSNGGDGETSVCVDAASVSASCPAQLNVDAVKVKC